MICRLCEKHVVGKQIAKNTGLCKTCNDKTKPNKQSSDTLYDKITRIANKT